MALDSLWYYSQKDEKRGPVTSSEIHRLAQRQKILPDDLVWCDGMESWVPARTIRGMFPDDDDAGLLTDMFDHPPEQATLAPASPSVKEPPSLEDVNRYDERQRDAAPSFQMRSIHFVQTHGRAIIVSSFLILLLCHGSERAGQMHVLREQSVFQMAQLEFNDRYDRQIAGFEADIFRLQAKPTLTQEQTQSLRDWESQLLDAKNQRAIEMAGLENGRWSQLRMSANSTRTNFAIWGYYRQILILLATGILAVGLFGRFFAGRQIEKWFCVIVLSLIAASFFVPSVGSPEELPSENSPVLYNPPR